MSRAPADELKVRYDPVKARLIPIEPFARTSPKTATSRCREDAGSAQ